MYHLTRCLVLGHNNCMSFVWTYNTFLPWYEFEETPNGALRHVVGTTEALSFSEWESTPSGAPADYYFASVSEGEASAQGGSQLDPSISAGISIGGGLVGSLEYSYKYRNITVEYAQRINGQVRNAQILTRARQMNAAKIGLGLKVVGRVATVLSVATAEHQFTNSNMSGNDYARLTGSLVITGTAFIPFVGPLISIGLGVVDSYGAFDNIYNYFE